MEEWHRPEETLSNRFGHKVTMVIAMDISDIYYCKILGVNERLQ